MSVSFLFADNAIIDNRKLQGKFCAGSAGISAEQIDKFSFFAIFAKNRLLF
jgi:hypothetical protein